MLETPRARTGWVDVAKGAAIVMVVVHHAVMALDARGVVPDAVSYVNYSLAALRMPLLFLVSGIFAATALQRSWREVLHRRVVPFGYLYVLWSVILFAFYSVVPTDLKDAPQGVGTLLRWAVDPGTGLWFIYGLALYSVLVKVMWRVPLALQVAVAAGVSVLGVEGMVSPGGFAWDSIAGHYLFFLLGVRGGRQVLTGAARVRPASAAGLVVLAAVAWVLRAGLDLHAVWGWRLVESLAVMAAVVALCVLVDRSGYDLGLRWLGARTLPVYLTHLIWIVVLTSPAVTGGQPWGPALSSVLIPVLVVVAITSSVAAHRLLVALHAGWLFALPRRWAWRAPGAPAEASPALRGA